MELTTKAREHDEESSGLCQEAPWLNDNTDYADEDCAATHAEVSRNQTSYIHALRDAILRDVFLSSPISSCDLRTAIKRHLRKPDWKEDRIQQKMFQLCMQQYNL